MTSREDRQREIDDNLAFFLKLMPTIALYKKGKFALIRHKEIVDYYDTVSDALSVGRKLFEDELFSIQQVTETAVNLGFYSHAVPLATA